MSSMKGKRPANILHRAQMLFSEDPSEDRQTLLQHLEEFRIRLIICAVAVAVGLVVCLFFSREIIYLLMDLGEGFSFVYVTPTELIMSLLKISLISGIILAIPVICFELYLYLCPGLRRIEKLVCLGAMISGMGCFLLGAFFCYRVIMPVSIMFLKNLNTIQGVRDMISIASYLEFVLTMICLFGITFEFPVISVLLTLTGLLNPNKLGKQRKYIIFATFILAAVITPPDVVTQMLVAIPLLALFEISIIICKGVYRIRKKRKHAVVAEYKSMPEPVHIDLD